ncbi:TPA: PTS sugar transporter subunit IIB [Streptococcus pyogenes]|uniref:PTS sugar transporter subunit IIB n=1 Tax=Streptococcus pyogenes TaxID=1314 RepID=UPI0010108ED9|nr:PTS sugar transporter subunit IIB [Streptococcus pyogenes]HER4625799.1 PTS sugar transporter subunit IIB [Streptococcus pyogenes NGAS604]HER4674487.1 PTS sugar transporter subunit IIB [Streptococcus pyogenes NGAS344]EMC5224296.1 PTS sugar transporter subunit IIB [Streptococcus pyogenes]MZX81815.1 PTS fructose transporter subunit IIB [Streptococcus pyogenes]NCI61488.1 PTS sugar transporter subunit IIB [Streptococcus pyogenes]
MIKILAACGAGVNSSHQIKDAIESQMTDRGYDVHCDAVMVKDITEELVSHYDIFTPIAKTDLGFDLPIPIVEAGPILYRIPIMSEPVFAELERVIKENHLQ